MAATAASAVANRPARSLPRMRTLPPPTASVTTPVGLLDDELAVHHRHAPIAALAEALGGLEAVAEEARALAEPDPLLGVDAGVAGRAGARQHALADAVLELGRERIGREAEQQHAHARAPVGRLLGLQLAVDADLGAAADDGGAKARSW